MHTVLTSKLPDFTEDPFRDYRYEDPFNITDPFADDVEDFNANKSNDTTAGKLDPFGYGTTSTFTSKNINTKGFDNDFSNTFSLTTSKTDLNNIKFNADFEKAFSDDNKNVKTANTDFTDTVGNAKSKVINIDEVFASKTDVFTKKQGHDQGFTRSKINLNDKKLKNDAGKIWNGNDIPIALTEEEQVAWASQQSIKAEEERRRRKEQEEADLALALELSKQEKSGTL